MPDPEAPNPPPPQVRFSLGVTGHRAGHTGFAESAARIETVLAQIMDLIDAAIMPDESRAEMIRNAALASARSRLLARGKAKG